MKKLLSFLFAILSTVAFAQTATEIATLNANQFARPYAVLAQPTAQSLAATGNVQWTVQGNGTYVLSLSNAPGATAAWVATVNFQTSPDGTSWSSVNANPMFGLPGAGQAAVTSATAVGLWKIQVPATANYIRANVSAWTSGTIWFFLESWNQNNLSIIMPWTYTVTTGNTLVGPFDASNIAELSIQVSAVTTTVITAQGTNDPSGTTWVSIPLIADNSANQALATTFSAAGTFSIVNPAYKWIRFQCTTTGTVLTVQGVAARYGQGVKLSAGQGSVGTNAATISTVTTVTTVSTVTTLSQFLASAAAADATANPTTTGVRDFAHWFNGTSWDRVYNNANLTTGDTGAKTATFNGATQTNFGAKGANIMVLISAVSGTTPTLNAQLQISPDGGTTWLNVGAATGNLTAAGTILIQVYPTNFSVAGATPAALTSGATVSLQLNTTLPRTWRLVYTIGGTTPSFTFTNTYVAYNN